MSALISSTTRAAGRPHVERHRPPNRMRGPVWRPISRVWRTPTLIAAKAIGRLQQPQTAWWPVVAVLSAAALLIIVPVLLALLVSAIPDGAKHRFGIAPAPRVHDWLSFGSVLIVAAGLVATRVVVAARRRVIVERFANYTCWTDRAVSGVATQLVGELGRLGDLFRRAHADVLVPPAVVVENHDGSQCGMEPARFLTTSPDDDGFQYGKEPARFLTASADGLTRVLEGMAASEATVEVGTLVKIPVGPMLSACNQLLGRRRVVGAVHSSDDRRSLALTAQLIGGRTTGTWRVERRFASAPTRCDQAVLDAMVRGLAYSMFTEVSFGGSARVKAVKAFAKYLRLYGKSSDTPGASVGLLRQAAQELTKAVNEDEAFGVAYYNLGMIYTKLAETERAEGAFLEATRRTPEHWQAHYALAVLEFTRNVPPAARRARLEEVMRHCDRALAAGPPARSSTAVVHDLRGMAAVRLADLASDSRGYFRAAVRDHRRAVAQSWRELCRAERLQRAENSADDRRVKQARKNAVAALRHLAWAYAHRAILARASTPWAERHTRLRRLVAAVRARRDHALANRIFRLTLDVAGSHTERPAAAQFDRGETLGHRGTQPRSSNPCGAPRSLGHAASAAAVPASANWPVRTTASRCSSPDTTF